MQDAEILRSEAYWDVRRSDEERRATPHPGFFLSRRLDTPNTDTYISRTF